MRHTKRVLIEAGVKSQLIKSESRKGYYIFDYVIQPDRQPERHLVVRGHTWRVWSCSTT